MPGVRSYRGVSADERHQQRRAKLVDACLTVIGREGVAATTVGAVCEQAGLTKRYFYESFEDREAILVDALDTLFRTVWERIQDALAGAGARRRARALVTVTQVVDVMSADARLARLYIESPGHPALHPRRQRAFQEYARLWAEDVLGVTDPEPADLVAGLLFVSGTTQVLIDWLEGSVDLQREELIAELASLGLAVGRNR